MAQSFKDEVVWITGAGSGLGRDLALRFAEAGAKVAISGRREDRLAEVVAELEACGAEALAVPCDVRDEDAVDRAVAKVVDHFGALHVAVANAGYSVVGRIERVSAADWRAQLETNVVGLTNTVRSSLPELRKTRGRVVLVGSVSSFLAMSGTGPYHASKFAVRAIGATLAIELHGSGVSCTTLHPGFVESEIARVDNAGVYDPQRRDARPAKLMWSSERASRVMIRAIARRRREVVFTGHGRAAAFVGRHFPGLVHFALTRGRLGYTRR